MDGGNLVRVPCVVAVRSGAAPHNWTTSSSALSLLRFGGQVDYAAACYAESKTVPEQLD